MNLQDYSPQQLKSFLGIRNDEEMLFVESLKTKSKSDILSLSNDLSKEFKIPILNADYGFQLKSDKRKIVEPEIIMPVDSFLRNWYCLAIGQILFCENSSGGYGDGHNSAKDTGGTIRIASDAPYSFYDSRFDLDIYRPTPIGVIGNIGETDRDVCVGSNATAVTFDDFNLNTLIAHGAGAGQLWYSWGFVYRWWEAGARKLHVRHLRYFDSFNVGGATIREIGMKYYLFVYAGSNTYSFLVLRDILTPEKFVPFRYQAKAYFDFYLTYP